MRQFTKRYNHHLDSVIPRNRHPQMTNEIKPDQKPLRLSGVVSKNNAAGVAYFISDSSKQSPGAKKIHFNQSHISVMVTIPSPFMSQLNFHRSFQASSAASLSCCSANEVRDTRCFR